MQRNIIALAVYFIYGFDHLDAGFTDVFRHRVKIGVVTDDGHAECYSSFGRFKSNPAYTDQSECLFI